MKQAYLDEVELQNQLIKNQLSILDSLNQNLNLNLDFNLTPCQSQISKNISRILKYQDLSCVMEHPQDSLDITQDLVVSLHSDLLQADSGLFSDKVSLYTIEIKDKAGHILNKGKCKTYNYSNTATMPDKNESYAFPSFLTSGESTISLDLDGKTKMPLDYTIEETNSKDDKKSLDLGLSLGLSRDFQVPSGQSMNISTGVEMPLLHGVESAQDVFNRDRFSLDPHQVTFKFQVHMKF